MRSLVATLGLLSGCADIFDLVAVDTVVPDAGADGGTDGATDCPFGRFGRNGSGGTGLFDVCLTEQPQDMFSAGLMIDTGVTSQCTMIVPQGVPSSESVCVIVAANIKILLTTQAVGNLPLVLVATDTIRVDGTLDVSSRRNAANGAGYNHGTCKLQLGGQDGVGTTIAGAGGAGGSFQTVGGSGGAGDSNATLGGIPLQDTLEVSYVRGGCRAGVGGNGVVDGFSGFGGAAGSGGGALYLIAGKAIVLGGAALLDASGESGGGGRAGPPSGAGQIGGGGGGGGSGGLIGLDAPTIRFEAGARLIANGAGGGAGASGAQDGGNGSSSTTSTYPFAAAGGSPGITGGFGADASRDARNGNSGGSDDAGGGGGGGVGFIKVYASMLDDQGARSSPPHN